MNEKSEKGPLTEAIYYILLSLVEPLHGYGIMQRVMELSKGRLEIGAGTLYGAINNLLQKDLIEPKKSPVESRKKVYKITDKGLLVLNDELLRLEELTVNGKIILKKE
ncbi:MAG: helix-turn-helix transcriptional regulator [Spirochaetales bacterium]|nr:helix-turn-helix transcriptional regulator [Spirochaetales bacterium]